MRNPQISVVIPVYNGAKFLEKTLGCLLRQTFSDFEALCIDDCSTDNSMYGDEYSVRVFFFNCNKVVFRGGTFFYSQDNPEAAAASMLRRERDLENTLISSALSSRLFDVWLRLRGWGVFEDHQKIGDFGFSQEN